MPEISAGTAAAAVIIAAATAAGFFHFMKPEKKSFIVNFIPWGVLIILLAAAFVFKGVNVFDKPLSEIDAALMAVTVAALSLMFLKGSQK